MPLSKYLTNLVMETIKNLPAGKIQKPVEVAGIKNIFIVEADVFDDMDKYFLAGGVKHNEKEYLVIMNI